MQRETGWPPAPTNFYAKKRNVARVTLCYVLPTSSATAIKLGVMATVTIEQ
jgi:hypothetical protein